MSTGLAEAYLSGGANAAEHVPPPPGDRNFGVSTQEVVSEVAQSELVV